MDAAEYKKYLEDINANYIARLVQTGQRKVEHGMTVAGKDIGLGGKGAQNVRSAKGGLGLSSGMTGYITQDSQGNTLVGGQRLGEPASPAVGGGLLGALSPRFDTEAGPVVPGMGGNTPQAVRVPTVTTAQISLNTQRLLGNDQRQAPQARTAPRSRFDAEGFARAPVFNPFEGAFGGSLLKYVNKQAAARTQHSEALNAPPQVRGQGPVGRMAQQQAYHANRLRGPYVPTFLEYAFAGGKDTGGIGDMRKGSGWWNKGWRSAAMLFEGVAVQASTDKALIELAAKDDPEIGRRYAERRLGRAELQEIRDKYGSTPEGQAAVKAVVAERGRDNRGGAYQQGGFNVPPRGTPENLRPYAYEPGKNPYEDQAVPMHGPTMAEYRMVAGNGKVVGDDPSSLVGRVSTSLDSGDRSRLPSRIYPTAATLLMEVMNNTAFQTIGGPKATLPEQYGLRWSNVDEMMESLEYEFDPSIRPNGAWLKRAPAKLQVGSGYARYPSYSYGRGGYGGGGRYADNESRLWNWNVRIT